MNKSDGFSRTRRRSCCSSRTRCLTWPWHIIPAPEALWRLTVPPVSAGANPDNFGVDSTRHTVLHLEIQLRQRVTIKSTSFLNIPNCSLLNNVPHEKPFDGLVLRTAFATVWAADKLGVATPVLVATSIPTLECQGSLPHWQEEPWASTALQAQGWYAKARSSTSSCWRSSSSSSSSLKNPSLPLMF